MNNDGGALKDADHKFTVWTRQLKQHVAKLVNKVIVRHGATTEPTFYALGSFHYCYKVQVDDGSEIILRFPMLGRSEFRYEKINDERRILAYLSRHTAIPTPEVLATENTSLGPFNAMRFVEGSLLSDRLQTPDSEGIAFLDPNIDI